MAEENSLVLKLKKPFTFEGKEYKEIDLSALESWTCDDVVNVQKEYFKLIGADVNALDIALIEGNLEYCQYVAAKASKLPLDFFKRLPASNAGSLRALVLNFFHGEV